MDRPYVIRGTIKTDYRRKHKGKNNRGRPRLEYIYSTYNKRPRLQSIRRNEKESEW